MRIISWFAIVCFPPWISYSVCVVSGYGRTVVHAFVRITLSQEKWPTQGRPSPCRSDIRSAKQGSSAARWPDILRRSYRLSTQSPASSQCTRRISLHALDYDTIILVFCQAKFSEIFTNFCSIFRHFREIKKSFRRAASHRDLYAPKRTFFRNTASNSHGRRQPCRGYYDLFCRKISRLGVLRSFEVKIFSRGEFRGRRNTGCISRTMDFPWGKDFFKKV